jgi:hypothetical protein
MGWLSLRLASLVLFGGTASLLGYASPAFAQIPAFRATDEPAPAPDVLPPPAPAPAPTLPPAPPPPVTALPASPNAPPPAKADRITTTDAPADGAPEAGREGDEPDDEPEGPPSKRPQWYGWQTLIADAPSLTAFVAGVSMIDDGNSGGSTLAWAGILGYELVPGIIHFAHGNPGRGFASLGMRFGMPLAGAIVGAAVASNCDSSLCELGGAGVGIMLGMGGAIAIDAAVLAYDDPKPSQARRRRLVPLASLTPHQAWFGVGGDL